MKCHEAAPVLARVSIVMFSSLVAQVAKRYEKSVFAQGCIKVLVLIQHRVSLARERVRR
jgi:hypothetical protein